ncbi:ZIP family metal transporter [Vulgatibacter incomptus]|uniref:Zinc transporter, ZIP family n=1 Tax=Vulgatibacter incomptus TaxID=1391653 RepID=A0A0K1P8Y0_9BACT|nr:ZIP family metal transporter [Vulgatibacter incomptus]AKU89980.1 Zinc transporter, ZIP family [Vulgatibacter incomptus]
MLTAYLLAIAVGAMLTAAVPVAFPRLQSRMHLFLSFSAGVMLGAAFFHMLPEAVESGGLESLYWSLGGFVFLFLLERYVLVHWCKEDDECEVHSPQHEHSHGKTVGTAAFVGMSLHTLTDGFALGTAIEAGIGASVFLAILFHKLPSSFSLAAILMSERKTAGRTVAYTTVFAAMLPLGALLYLALAGVVPHEVFGARALGFSAGTFLHLAVADLIPDLHRRRQDRLALSIALIVGIVLMWAVGHFGPAHQH